MRPDESHSRGYLPHLVREGALYFVTFRLADSLPKEFLIRLDEELRTFEAKRATDKESNTRRLGNLRYITSASESDQNIEKEKRKRIEAYLDQGTGASFLKDQRIGTLACETLRFFDGQRYELHDWVIMPNHIHALVQPIPPFRLRDILHSWKLNIARHANQILRRTGARLWQPESFDRIIRDDQEKAAVRRYIRQNPVKANLCTSEEQWQFSSAHVAQVS